MSDQPRARHDFNLLGAGLSTRPGVSRDAASAHGRPPLPHRGGTAGSARDARRSRRRARATSDPRQPRTERSVTDGHTRTARSRVAWRWRGCSSRSPLSPRLDHSRKTSSSCVRSRTVATSAPRSCCRSPTGHRSRTGAAPPTDSARS